MSSRNVCRAFFFLIALSVLLLGLPLVRMFRHETEMINLWSVTLQVIVPAVFFGVVGMRYVPAGDAPTPNAARLIEMASVPYAAFVFWIIAMTLWERDSTTVGTVLASVVVLVTLVLYLRFVEGQLAEPDESSRWYRSERITSVFRTVTPVLGALLVVLGPFARDLRHALTTHAYFITRAEGVGSAAGWTRPVETVLGFAFTAGAMLLVAVVVASLALRRRHRPTARLESRAATIAAVLAFVAVADYYFGWFYAFVVGALSDWDHSHKWRTPWMVAAAALWLATTLAIPLLVALRRRSRTAIRVAFLVYSPLMLFTVVMLPLLSESLEARGESQVLLGLQLLAWYFVDRAAAAEAPPVERVSEAHYAAVGAR